jgi:glycosyltransferase involved in cell wall biosynthesis
VDSSRPRISVIIATLGRPTLGRAIRSSRWADEIVVVFDAETPPRHPKGCVVLARGPTDDYAATQRNVGMHAATGTHFAFMDDDDRYTRVAGRAIRAAVHAQPDRVHIFRMRNRDKVYSGEVASGAIGTPMYVVPRDPVAQYGGYDGTDFGFISETLALRGEEPVPHREIVAMIRPPTVRSGLAALGDPTKIKRVSKRWARYALALLRGART